MPGSQAVNKASWIEVQPVKNQARLAGPRRQFSLGLGELSTVILAGEIKAELVLIDDLAARKNLRDGKGCLNIKFSADSKIRPS